MDQELQQIKINLNKLEEFCSRLGFVLREVAQLTGVRYEVENVSYCEEGRSPINVNFRK